MSSESSNNGGYHWDDELNKKLQDFSGLLDSIESLDERTKVLWKDIYSNAFSDRKLAQNLFDNLWEIVRITPESHAIHGDRLSKYIERMSKANDQLIKLADLVESAKDKSEEIDGGAIYGQIGQGRK